MPLHSPGNQALLKDYERVMVVHKPLIRPYFLRETWHFGGVQTSPPSPTWFYGASRPFFSPRKKRSAQALSEISAHQVYTSNQKEHTVDGRNPANQLIGSLSHDLQGFSTIPGGCLGFILSTVGSL